MQLNRGDFIKTTDGHNRPVAGEIIQLLEHTIIVAKGEERVVVLKKTLTQAGYTFPRFKWRKAFMTVQDRAEES